MAVSDEEILIAQREMAQEEGIFACPEGAATLTALVKLKERDLVGAEERDRPLQHWQWPEVHPPAGQ